MSKKVIFEDRNDTLIGEMEEPEAHKTVQRHRAVSVLFLIFKGNSYYKIGLNANTIDRVLSEVKTLYSY